MRGAEDVAVLRPAPWWTPKRLALALIAAGALLLLALGWAALLRQQVAERSAQLAGEMRSRHEGEVEFAATLRERERIAADLHDTLEQALAGVTFQLEAGESFRATSPERSDRHQRIAHQLLVRTREDVRRSVWNLRAQALDGRTLPEALRNVAESAGAGRAVAIEVAETGAPRPLSEFVAGNLLLLAQEAVTNAMKHATPTRIRLGLNFAPERVTLAIEDDGAGFYPATAPGAREGHFGLQGMTERVKRLGGTFSIESGPGRGTRITAAVPASAD
jgi:signal transduction histidine kinase